MKPLKQIREELNHSLLKDAQITDEVMLEAMGSTRPESSIPSNKQMPTMLLFRRVTYRVYPRGQVVALYYSKMVDKYLSIPFGPTGNLNISESKVYDTLEELEEGLASTLDAGAEALVPYYSAGKKAIKGDWKGAAKDAAVDTGLMVATGGLGKLAAGGVKLAARGAKAVSKGAAKAAEKVGVKSAEKSVAKAETPRSMDVLKPKKPSLMDRIKGGGKKVSGLGAAGAVGAALAGSSDSKESGAVGTTKPVAKPILHTDTHNVSKVNRGDAVYQSKMKQASLKAATNPSVNENKITDIRKMIKENVEYKDIFINGKTITLNNNMAKRIVEVYDSVNTKNKKIVESMLNKDLESFKRLLTFSIRN